MSEKKDDFSEIVIGMLCPGLPVDRWERKFFGMLKEQKYFQKPLGRWRKHWSKSREFHPPPEVFEELHHFNLFWTHKKIVCDVLRFLEDERRQYGDVGIKAGADDFFGEVERLKKIFMKKEPILKRLKGLKKWIGIGAMVSAAGLTAAQAIESAKDVPQADQTKKADTISRSHESMTPKHYIMKPSKPNRGFRAPGNEKWRKSKPPIPGDWDVER